MNEEIIKILVEYEYTQEEAVETVKNYEDCIDETRGVLANAIVIMDLHRDMLDYRS